MEGKQNKCGRGGLKKLKEENGLAELDELQRIKVKTASKQEHKHGREQFQDDEQKVDNKVKVVLKLISHRIR